MSASAITQYIDVAQLALYAFWLFFAGLVYYLRGEDKREGYPLQSDVSHRTPVQGFPRVPDPKTFALPHGGGTVQAPGPQAPQPELRADPVGAWPGAPLQPTGDPMLDAVGPASYANRANVPDLTFEGAPKIVPLRVATDFSIESRDPDPRGMEVVGADGNVGGVIRDVWVDRAEAMIRYLEADVQDPQAPAGARRVLVPINFARVDGRRRQVRVKALLARHFANVPALANGDQVTLLEEDRIMGYYGGGHLYATPERLGPVL
jgi:photosynthetic reaction center H subunit